MKFPAYPFIVALLLFVQSVFAAKYVMKDGRTYEGKHGNLAKVDEKAEDVGKEKVRLITVIDDGLRRIYIPKYNITEVAADATEALENFKTKLQYAQDGNKLELLGEYNNAVPFDAFGRRLLTINHYGGTDYFSQAITELTPKYVRVRGVHQNSRPIVWDMRLASNSLPRQQITPILMNQIDPKNIEDRLRLVRFYIQGKLLEEAATELYAILDDWKDDLDVKRRLSGVFRMVEQQKYQQRIDELEGRWKAGQFNLVYQLLTELEKDENLPAPLKMSVRRMLQRYNDFDRKRTDIIDQLQDLYKKLPADQQDKRIPAILQEIEKELSLNTIERFASFTLHGKEEKISPSEKLAIGITGWFAGSNADNSRLTVAVSLPEVRTLILDYLQSGDDNIRRREILMKIKGMEASRPALIAKILSYMKPPKEDENAPKDKKEADAQQDRPGFFRFELKNPLGNSVENIRYAVQLPPEYDANRHYPVIVSLNGTSKSPEMMLDWWAGTRRGRQRLGHAGRYGYIVVAPDWNPKEIKQQDYDFSAFSHAAVLLSLKDVFRRFSVDTDRVFISGHGIGGTAAWDIAMSHPDLWAGAMPFNALGVKYILAYKQNVNYVPLYLIWGELEGIGNQSKFVINAPLLNHYLDKQHHPPDATVVRFIGRGEEGFSDEILNLFDWMALRTRNFAPTGFETIALRAWDCFYWWLEIDDMEKEKPENLCDPLFWTDGSKLPKNSIIIKSNTVKAANTLKVTTAPRFSKTTVFLTPEMLDLNNKVSVIVNNKTYQPPNGFVEGDAGIILEDARTRGDRLRPFWVRLDGSKPK